MRNWVRVLAVLMAMLCSLMFPACEAESSTVPSTDVATLYPAAEPSPASPEAKSMPGDFNGDGRVDLQDLLLFLDGWGTTYTLNDFLALLDNWGQIAEVEYLLWHVDQVVIDAEYSRALDRIVTISASPNRLHILDPATQTAESLNLPLPPSSVSVGPDGLFAAVGHDARISYVNLSTLELVQVYTVSIDVFDVVLAGNGFVYAFAGSGAHGRVRCIELSTGTETQHTGGSVYQRTRGRLHPSGDFMYGADNGLSPSDIEKFDLRDGTAVRLYDSPYHGDYAFGGDLWISGDGLRVFARSGHVFRASEVRAEDLLYNGSLYPATGIAWMDAADDGTSYVAPAGSPIPGEIRVFNQEGLVQVDLLLLSPVRLGAENGAFTQPAEGAFVFLNSAQQQLHALYHAQGLAEFPDAWVVASFDLHGEGEGEGEDEGEGEEAMWRLDHLVIDAEHDRTNDRVVTVSDTPRRLHVLEPWTRTASSVELAYAPLCVAVRPDGAYAAVGHNRRISYVNLGTLEVEAVFEVDIDVFDILLPSNGWIYAMPRTGQWVRIHSIEIATGVVTLSIGSQVRAGTKMKLHPSGKYAYGADNGLSPSDIEKYDLQPGTASRLYDSPYHGDFAFSGDLWIADDGLRIFVRSGSVFTSSETREADMIYNGRLSDHIAVLWLDTAIGAGWVVAAPRGASRMPHPGQVHVYEQEFLNLEKVVPLPHFPVHDGQGGTREFDAEGGFVFAAPGANAFHALHHAVANSGLLYDWAITTHQFEED